MQRSTKIISGLFLAASLTLAAVAGFAQQPPQGRNGQERAERRGGPRGGDRERGGAEGGFEGRFFERLNLTDAQKEQMKQIAARYREGFKAKRQEGRGPRGGGGDFDLFNGGAFNEAAVRAAAQARANERVEMEVAHAHMMFEMYNVLTAEQKAQLAAERQQHEQKRQEWRSRRGANLGQNQ